MLLGIINWNAIGGVPDPPAGFAYLVNADNAYILNANGSYILVKVP